MTALKEGKIYGFLKFTDYWKELLDGQVYMNSLNYYLDEEEHGVGRGDSNEGHLIFNGGELRVTNTETGELVTVANMRQVKIRAEEELKNPVYCLLALDSKTLVSYEETETEYIFKVKSEYIEQLSRDFDTKYVVLIHADPFIERITDELKKQNINFLEKKVSYSNILINDVNRIKASFSGGEEICYWKDERYEHQNEWRLMLKGNEQATGPYILEVGDLRDIAVKTTVKVLKNQTLISLPKEEN